jgi:hypothetical protein
VCVLSAPYPAWTSRARTRIDAPAFCRSHSRQLSITRENRRGFFGRTSPNSPRMSSLRNPTPETSRNPLWWSVRTARPIGGSSTNRRNAAALAHWSVSLPPTTHQVDGRCCCAVLVFQDLRGALQRRDAHQGGMDDRRGGGTAPWSPTRPATPSSSLTPTVVDCQ